MSKTKKPEPFVLPPHINAEPHKRLMERLDKMTKAEQLQSLVNAGICDNDGKLMPPYNGEELQEPTTRAKRSPKAIAAKTTRR
jgi:hypothetical protein